MNLVVSAMFYSDETMHKIYVDEGLFDFIYQLPQMIYSFIIFTVLVNILNLLGLYEEDIVGIKKYKKSEKDISKVMSKIKIKIISFFIICYILIFLFWVYLGSFCAVYKNTQKHLLIEVSTSLIISLETPFIIVLFPCIFRILSLKKKKPLLLKFSNFLLNFL